MSWPIRERFSGKRDRCLRFVLVAALLFSCHVGLATTGAPCTSVFLQEGGPQADSNEPADRRFSLFRPTDTLLPAGPGIDGHETFHLFLATEPAFACLHWNGAGAAASGPSPRLPSPSLTRLVTIGSLAAVGLVEYALWWKNGKRTDFHFVSEGWFGPDEYTGGADKVSHFVGGYIGEQILEALYRSAGHSAADARMPALFVTIAEGILIEFGDSFKGGGFSWQDIATDAFGAMAAEEIGRRGWQDMVGVRWGQTGTRIPTASQPGPQRSPYSNEIYLIDAKLNGIIRRFGKDPGLARFFLVSASYETKGYGLEPLEVRQRNLGIELGPNLPEVLRALGVRDDSWWGKPLLALLTFYRPPLTTIGLRYDFNARRWRGPDAGNKPY